MNFEVLSNILPRFYRRDPKSCSDTTTLFDLSQSTSATTSSSHPSSSFSSLHTLPESVLPVTWLPGFYAAPGYLKHDDRIGVAYCASSEVSVRSLLEDYVGDSSHRSGVRVLDLCCCPGMKYCSIAEKLSSVGRVRPFI